MTTKMEHFPAKNPNPVLNIEKNGTVLYSNEAAKPLLIEWSVRVGERLPSNIVDLVQRVISLNSPEKLEVKAGNSTYLLAFHPLFKNETVNIYGFDISDQKKLEEKLQKREEALKESEERLILAQQVAGIGTFEWNIQTGINLWTHELEAMYGLRPGEFGKTQSAWEQLVHPDDRQKAISIVEHAFHTNEPVEGEWRVAWPDGSVHWLTGRVQVFRDEAGQPQRLTGVNFDITERKLAEEALHKANEKLQAQSEGIQVQNEELQAQSKELQVQNEELQAQSEELQEANEALAESEERFHTMANAIPQLAWIARADGYIYWYNERWYAYTGTTPEQMEGWGWQSVHDPAVLPKVLEQWKASIASGQQFDMEFPLRGTDGVFRPFLTRVLPLRDAKGQVLQWFGTNTDITERKQEEYRIRRYNRILNGINRIFSNVVQAKTEEDLGNTCLSVALEVTGSGIGFVGEVGGDGLLHDIAISDMGWKQCMMYDKIGHHRPPGNFVLHGLYGSVIDSGKGFFTNDPQSHPHSIGLPNGHPPLTSFLGVPLIQDGISIGMIAVANREGGYSCEQLEDLEAIAPAVMQALKRKKAEDDLKKAHEECEGLVKERTADLEEAFHSLKESEKSLAEAQKTAHIGSWERYFATNKFSWSDEMYRILGLKPQEFEINYSSFLNYVHPDDRDYVDNAVKRALNGKPYVIDYRIIQANGEERIVYAKGEAFFDEQNNPVRIRGITQDITESKKAEEALRQSEERFNLAVKAAQEGVWDWNMETDVVWYSSRYKEMLGYSEGEIEHHVSAWLRLLHPDDKERSLQLVDAVMRGERNYELEFRLRHKDGYYLNILSRGYPVRRESDGKIVRIVGIHLDLTERKHAEEEIQNLANIVESSNDAIVTKSFDDIITSWNKGAKHIYGYSAEEIIGKPISILEPPVLAGETNRLGEKIKQGEKIQQYETLRLRKDGKMINVSLTFSPVLDVSGKMTAISVIARDITKRKETEEALAKIEIARKKEIHHRIKNNLQVISSLLDLQADKFRNKECIKDSEVLEAFRENQDRVISMALIHEELYKGGGFETLNFSPYIQELAENLYHTYSVGNNNISLKLNLAENAFFDMDVTVPLGMIVNELVTNSFKHAFFCKDKGEIQIKLSKEENGECINEDCESTSFALTVSDNGIGIPENLDIKDLDSLGLQLVTTLVDQLDGELELRRDNGTEFIIRFMVKKNNNSVSVPTTQQSVK